MQKPVQIVFDGFERSDALEENIRAHVDKLEQFSEHIIGCRVAIENEHRHKRQGRQYHVRITVNVPGKELVVSQDRHDKPEHEDPHIAIRDAFSSMTRQLEDRERVVRGDVKHHESPAPTRADESEPGQA